MQAIDNLLQFSTHIYVQTHTQTKCVAYKEIEKECTAFLKCHLWIALNTDLHIGTLHMYWQVTLQA